MRFGHVENLPGERTIGFQAQGSLTFKTTNTYEIDSKGSWMTRGSWSYDKSQNTEKLAAEVITRTITYY